MGTYVVGDVHGCLSQWLAFKEKIERMDRDARFILVGDIVDRGKETFEMIEWAIENISDNGKYQMVIGNHEHEKIEWWDIMVSRCIEECALDVNFDNSGDLDSVYEIRYDFLKHYRNRGLGLKAIKKHIDFFKTLKYYKDLEIGSKRFIVAHAGLPDSIIKEDGSIKDVGEMSKKELEYILWDRSLEPFTGLSGTMVVHGHTPTVSHCAFTESTRFTDRKLGKIAYYGNRCNVDCGLVFKSNHEFANLGALRLEDGKEFYLF